MKNKIYLYAIGLVFSCFVIVFVFFPKSRYSSLEKRELKTFPDFSFERLKTGDWTSAINAWFSDTEAFRDKFMSLSMMIKHGEGIAPAGQQVVFHAAVNKTPASLTSGSASSEQSVGDQRNFSAYQNDEADENAKIANAGIIIVGSGKNVRALMAFGGGSKGGTAYSEAVNAYKKAFGQNVNVYCMVIPTAIDYYCPANARSFTRQQQPAIHNIYRHLDKDVQAVNIYTVLGQHAKEPIYLRTDHHWSPLGAYYAALQFSKVAGVPFKTLKSYTRQVVHGYIGSMYGYSNDISLKNAPEDFVYYIPKGVSYTTTYTDYQIDKHYHVTGEGKPHQSVYFVKFRDGSGGAYCTFMGADTKITHVHTSTKSHRRLLVLKDSFGNAIPGYLFYSFSDIYVVDYRYFTRNMRDFVHQNAITDILFADNIFQAYSPKTAKKYMNFLTQKDPFRH
jgi:hypothetical protein